MGCATSSVSASPVQAVKPEATDAKEATAEAEDEAGAAGGDISPKAQPAAATANPEETHRPSATVIATSSSPSVGDSGSERTANEDVEAAAPRCPPRGPAAADCQGLPGGVEDEFCTIVPQQAEKAPKTAAEGDDDDEALMAEILQDVEMVASSKGRHASVMHTMAEQDASVDSKAAAEVLVQQAADMENSILTPTMALIAHDNMKNIMRQFALVHLEMLRDFRLIGTGTTCSMLREVGLEPIGSTASGPLGGDQQIGVMSVAGEVHAVFFFRDPFSAHAHIADIEALSRIADCYQVYYGGNYRSASAILSFMHGNLKKRRATGRRCSIMKPEGMSDLAEAVQSNYKSTRAAALEKSK
ncbi:unnamed protein product [Polarella glacialis]|uniref:MGS-like domain-containing protein n=1 Tax=Polarella glacialis TaxID=89957 RepID=A0A813KGI6_POLGL|nr:unnamed protein product [Polarella glacialis]